MKLERCWYNMLKRSARNNELLDVTGGTKAGVGKLWRL